MNWQQAIIYTQIFNQCAAKAAHNLFSRSLSNIVSDQHYLGTPIICIQHHNLNNLNIKQSYSYCIRTGML